MFRKLITLFVSIALALAGVQPGVARMVSQSINETEVNMEQMAHGHTNLQQTNSGHGTMDHMQMGHMDMAETEIEPDHSCCPDGHDKAPCDGNCAMSWLACAIHCGFAAPVFLSLQEFQAWRSYRGEGEPPGVFLGLTSIDASPPFHPPKRSVRV
jgi:hypothetical protein